MAQLLYRARHLVPGRRAGLRTQLALGLLAAGALPLLASAALLYTPATTALTATIFDGLESTASVQEARVSSAVQGYLDMARLVGSRTVLRRTLDQYNQTRDTLAQAAIYPILDDARASVRGLQEITVIGTDGVVAASTDRGREGQDLSRDAGFTGGRERYRLIDLFRAPDAPLAVQVAGPLLIDERWIGVMLLSAHGDRLLAVTDDYAGLGQTGETLLGRRTADGGALYLNPLRFERDAALSRQVPSADSHLPIVQAVNRREATLTGTQDYRGRNVVASARYLPEVDWGLVVKRDEEEAYGPVAPLRNALVLSALALLVAVPMASFWLARAIAGPLLQLTQVATAIRSGDLARRAPVGGSTEVRTLAQAFNSMADSLIDARRGLEDRTGQAERANAELVKLTAELEDRVAARTAELETRNQELGVMSQQLWQTARLATMGELAASVAHELNNPLATVSLHVESALARFPESDPRRRSLQVIEEEIERMGNLVASLLQFSRQGRRQISTVDLPQEIAAAVDLVQSFLHNRSIVVAQKFEAGVPAVRADRQLLRQLFLNLITNASDAMPGGGKLTIRVTSKDDRVAIEFIDTGAGIAPEDLSRVREPFFTTKPEGQGTGLGLAICQRIAEEHQGTLDIASELGAGTTVRVEIPVTVNHNGEHLA